MTHRTISAVVLEDSLVQGRVIAQLLGAQGCAVRIAKSAHVFRQIIDSDASVDVILLDVHLEDGDGIELIAPIRKRWPKAVVVVMTADARNDFGALARARDQRADLVLRKPFGEAEAGQLIDDVRLIIETGKPRTHVVVIDDSAAVGKLVTGFLVASGLRATAFTKFEDVMQRLNYDHVDVVLTDLMMPEMSGHEIISLVRDVWPEVAVIAMSGASQSDVARADLKRAQALGAVGVLGKPFTAEQLAAVVAQAMRAKAGDNLVLDF